jgi:hypothetical protein
MNMEVLSMKCKDLAAKLMENPNFDVIPKVELKVSDEELQKRTYGYPYDVYNAELEVMDVSYSDRQVAINISLIGDKPVSDTNFGMLRDDVRLMAEALVDASMHVENGKKSFSVQNSKYFSRDDAVKHMIQILLQHPHKIVK